MKKLGVFLFVLAVAAFAYAATIGKRTWEYRFLEGDTKIDITKAKLNQLDGEGWDVVGFDGGLFLLKRKYQE